MKMFVFKISTKLKDEIKDPKGEVVEQISKKLNIASNLKVQKGSFYKISIEASDYNEACCKIEKIAKEILTNPLVETYEIESAKEKC